MSSQKGYPLVVRAEDRAGLASLPDAWRYRSLIRLLATRDVKLRFRQTRLGVAWLFINPLLFTAGYAFLFGSVGNVKSHGANYFVFTYVGISLWGSFNLVFGRCQNCLIQNRALLTQAYFPRLTVPLAAVLTTQVDVGISLGLLALFLAVGVSHVPLAVLLVPVWFVLMQAIALALGLLVASWTIAFRDLQTIATQVLALGPVFIPVAYPTSALPHYARFLAVANPLTPLLDAMRASTLGYPWPHAWALAYAVTSVVLLLVAGLAAFERADRKLADVI